MKKSSAGQKEVVETLPEGVPDGASEGGPVLEAVATEIGVVTLEDYERMKFVAADAEATMTVIGADLRRAVEYIDALDEYLAEFAKQDGVVNVAPNHFSETAKTISEKIDPVRRCLKASIATIEDEPDAFDDEDDYNEDDADFNPDSL